MNKKLIALAVSSALVAPVVMADDSGPTVYGRVNLAIAINDSGDDTTTDLRDVVSRFGVRGEEDLGNGLAAVYRYEFRVNADRGSIRADANEQRLSYVGLKGGFGQVIAGSIWGTHFNLTGTHLDPSYSLGYFGYSSYGGGDYRIQHAINYTGDFGPVTFSTDVRIDGNDAADDNIDQFVVGLKYNGPLTAAVVYDTRKVAGSDADGNAIEGDDDRKHTSAILAYSGEGYNVNVGWQNLDDESNGNDRDTYHINAGIDLSDTNRLLLGYWNGEGNGDDNSEGDGILLGFYHSISSRTRVYFEGHVGEIDDADKDLYLIGMRHDF